LTSVAGPRVLLKASGYPKRKREKRSCRTAFRGNVSSAPGPFTTPLFSPRIARDNDLFLIPFPGSGTLGAVADPKGAPL
jgi:hypothetical protein